MRKMSRTGRLILLLCGALGQAGCLPLLEEAGAPAAVNYARLDERLAFGSENERLAAIRQLGAQDTLLALRLCARAESDAQSTVRKAARVAADHLGPKLKVQSEQLFKSANPMDQRFGFEQLVLLGGPTAEEVILEALKGADESLCGLAAKYASLRRSDRAFPVIVQKAGDRTQTLQVRLEAVRALKRYRRLGALPTLYRIVEERFGVLSWHAIEAILALRERSTVPFLMAHLAGPGQEKPNLAWAIGALVEVTLPANERAVPALLDWWEKTGKKQQWE